MLFWILFEIYQYEKYWSRKGLEVFVGDLSIQIKGIGKVTALHLESLEIQTVNDIHGKRGILKLIEYPSAFDFLMRVCHGCGSTAIEHDDLQKSIGHETFVPENSLIQFRELLFVLLGHSIVPMIHRNWSQSAVN